MPTVIIHKDGAYNLYCTVSDCPTYESALTLKQLKAVLRREGGKRAIAALPLRLERAHQKGTSSCLDSALERTIELNRAGPGESRLPVEDFIKKYLTLPAGGKRK